MQLVELQKIAGTLSEHGYALFAISYDSVETLSGFAAKNGIEFPLLSDEGSKVITALGLLDEDLDRHHAQFGGTVRDEQRGVCYPGVFVLDERGTVTERRFQRNYRVRESGSCLLEQALGIASAKASPGVELDRERVRLRARLDSTTYWRYQRLNAIVELDVAPGSHIYAAPTPDGYLPLDIEVSGAAVETAEPVWPESKPFRVTGLDEAFQTYEGRVRVAVPFEVVVPRGEELGDRTIKVRVRYQACGAATCDLPDEASFELRVQERPAVE